MGWRWQHGDDYITSICKFMRSGCHVCSLLSKCSHYPFIPTTIAALKTIRRSFVSSAQQIHTLKSATDTVFYICFEQTPSMYNAYYKKKKANMWQRVASRWYTGEWEMMKLYLSWTVRWWPALRSLDAMCAPMLPSPTNPTRCCHPPHCIIKWRSWHQLEVMEWLSLYAAQMHSPNR